MGLRNVVQRRNHKERSQPLHRRKYGLLEKHKDYIERAKDHHSKRDRLQRLRQKASERNADEFNFGMLRSAPKQLGLKSGGMHVERRKDVGSEPLHNALVALLKTQDVGYIRVLINKEKKKSEELVQRITPMLAFTRSDWVEEGEGREETLVKQGLLKSDRPKDPRRGVRLAAGGKKTVFVDDEDEVRAYKPSKEDVQKDASKGRINSKGKVKSREEELMEEIMNEEWNDDVDEFFDDESREDGMEEPNSKSSRAERHLGYLVSQLSARQKRLKVLETARDKLEVVRALMTSKGQSVKKIDKGKMSQQLKDDVLKGKVTPNGLALPGTEDEEEEDEEEDMEPSGSSSKKPKRTIWKWGKERKK